MNWIKASACASNACVEVALGTTTVQVRDVANQTIEVGRRAWLDFIATVRRGELDRG